MPSTGYKQPGDLLDFANQLKQQNLWPLHYQTIKDDSDRKLLLRPLLMLAYSPDDKSDRPLRQQQPFHSSSISLVKEDGKAATYLEPNHTYSIRCRVSNLGGMTSYACGVEFYVASPETFDRLSHDRRPGIPHLGFTNAVVPANQTVLVTCPVQWQSPNVEEYKKYSVLVQVYDLITDPLLHPFNVCADTHVGRIDFPLNTPTPDFSGRWLGKEFLMGYSGDEGSPILLDISQTGMQITQLAIHSRDVYGALSLEPQIRHCNLPITFDQASGTWQAKEEETEYIPASNRGISQGTRIEPLNTIKRTWLIAQPDAETIEYSFCEVTTWLTDKTQELKQ